MNQHEEPKLFRNPVTTQSGPEQYRDITSEQKQTLINGITAISRHAMLMLPVLMASCDKMKIPLPEWYQTEKRKVNGDTQRRSFNGDLRYVYYFLSGLITHFFSSVEESERLQFEQANPELVEHLSKLQESVYQWERDNFEHSV